jgi:hypothetical protein
MSQQVINIKDILSYGLKYGYSFSRLASCCHIRFAVEWLSERMMNTRGIGFEGRCNFSKKLGPNDTVVVAYTTGSRSPKHKRIRKHADPRHC